MQMTEQEMNALMPKLRKRAARLTANRAEAEDLCQEALLRLWQALAEKREIETPDHYAMVVLHNLARRNWRNQTPQTEIEDHMLQAAPEGPARMACAQLSAAIEALPEDQAQLMRLVAAGETSPAVLAAQTGLPPGTVMSRLARARKVLRGQMGLKASSPVAELL
ncbi:MAG: RNA polymerase sigma factor [Sulfitobacter sp.]